MVQNFFIFIFCNTIILLEAHQRASFSDAVNQSPPEQAYQQFGGDKDQEYVF